MMAEAQDVDEIFVYMGGDQEVPQLTTNMWGVAETIHHIRQNHSETGIPMSFSTGCCVFMTRSKLLRSRRSTPPIHWEDASNCWASRSSKNLHSVTGRTTYRCRIWWQAGSNWRSRILQLQSTVRNITMASVRIIWYYAINCCKRVIWCASSFRGRESALEKTAILYHVCKVVSLLQQTLKIIYEYDTTTLHGSVW